MTRNYTVAQAGLPSAFDTSRGVRQVHQVIDLSDGESVVGSFRNKVLADRLAATSPAYSVRSHTF